MAKPRGCWITAAGTDDGSAGVQFGITDLSITQYDASGFAHPVDLRHTALVPGPPPGSSIAGWDLGSELLGRPGCALRRPTASAARRRWRWPPKNRSTSAAR
jgi:hypothetical protein